MLYEQALPLMRAVGDRVGEAAILSNLGVTRMDAEQLERAIDDYRQSLLVSEEVGRLRGEIATRYNIAGIYAKQGRLEEAIAEMTQGIDLERQTQHPDLEQDMEALERLERELSSAAN